MTTNNLKHLTILKIELYYCSRSKKKNNVYDFLTVNEGNFLFSSFYNGAETQNAITEICSSIFVTNAD